ncbi:holin family protein [Yoonia litorea]|uniref:Holin of 3TMs, for gene-transfer release n=1 Tax=Yoonia litorea TaxID=1123755 RepID=A0A1I6MAW2_9RHOB|nr:holin family protein [Yoonia litorea]SFS12777.1 Holin of 3TMs, for gene-transfer release [Yoonia litorea]
MGMITGLMGFLFGDGRNVVADTVTVFRENAENGAVREADARSQSLSQFAAEFQHQRRGVFDRFVDGVNRLPRPVLALGTIWLFTEAMRKPEEFAEAMVGLAAIPEPLWWLMGAVVSFYFGARHQAKAHEFQNRLTAIVAQSASPASSKADNPALEEWRARNAD